MKAHYSPDCVIFSLLAARILPFYLTRGFYQLKVEGKKYRVEIRFKGDIWSSSSQFQAHYTDSPDSGLAGGKTRKLRRR